MKKLKFLFCFLFVLFALGSISVFAADPSPADFKDNFQIYRFLAYNIPENDFSYSYDNDGDGRSTQADYNGNFDDCPSSYAYSFRIQSDNASFKRVLPPGYVVSGRLWFNVILPIDDPADLQNASVLLYDYPDDNFWTITGKTKVSDINFVESVQTYSYGTEWRCYADIFYANETSVNADARDFSFQFMFRLKNTASAPSPYRIATFDLSVENYYYGGADSPSAPAFKDYDVYNDTINEEDSLVNEAIGGYTDATDKFEDFADILDPEKETSAFYIFGSSMLFITALFEYLLARISLLESLLYVSIFFGLCGFFLNILPSMVSTFKHRGESERFSKHKKGDSA